MISSLELPAVQDKPKLFSTVLMWLLAELFEQLPEVGDLPKPKLVFLFDEAHLLFDGATGCVSRLSRANGAARPLEGCWCLLHHAGLKDIPADVLAQLGNRIQHALRAFTPEDAKALKATITTFPKSTCTTWRSCSRSWARARPP